MLPHTQTEGGGQTRNKELGAYSCGSAKALDRIEWERSRVRRHMLQHVRRHSELSSTIQLESRWLLDSGWSQRLSTSEQERKGISTAFGRST